MATTKKSPSNAEIKSDLVRRLELDLLAFKNICEQIPKETVNIDLRHAIYELGINVIDFIDQYRLTDKSVTNPSKMPGARKNLRERDYFREVVMEYQNKFPNKFPGWDTFYRDLDSLNVELVKL